MSIHNLTVPVFNLEHFQVLTVCCHYNILIIHTKVLQVYYFIIVTCKLRHKAENCEQLLVSQKNVPLQKRILTQYQTMRHFDKLKIYTCGKHCEKGDSACNKKFIIFLRMFSTLWHLFYILNAL